MTEPLSENNNINKDVITPHAYIKSIAIEVSEDYSYDNSPFIDNSPEKDTNSFIGRVDIRNKFLKFLTSSSLKAEIQNPSKPNEYTTREYKKGVYLVTGYRGMGKTSFVNNVIGEYKKEMLKPNKEKPKADTDKHILSVYINLAQKQPSEMDILRLMVSYVYDECFKRLEEPIRQREAKIFKEKNLVTVKALSLFAFFVALIYLIIKALSRGKAFLFSPLKTSLNTFLSDQFLFLICCIFSFLIFFWAKKIQKAYIELRILKENDDFLYGENGKPLKIRYSDFELISNLKTRCYTPYTLEKNSKYDFSFEQLGAKFSGPSEKQTTNYPIASSKEIEYELNKFLEVIADFAEFIFVFDELDKIEPTAIGVSYFNDSDGDLNVAGEEAYLLQIRQRKQAIINIIAGLKNFLTSANARFIFIAGREMFDATLADVSDRQSSLGSIFNYVFYIESFLKENLGGTSRVSLSGAIEDYLCRVFFPRGEIEAFKKDNLDDAKDTGKLYQLITRKILEPIHGDEFDENEKQLRAWKVITLVQNFVIYLAYRSNGSPKKIIKTVHEFLHVKDNQEEFKADTRLIVSRSGSLPDAFLFFDYTDQYIIGFINHLYRPFLIRYGHSYKKYSDNILISTTYLFDHLLKFHPFAFSFANLELIPEIISTSKTPFLREHISTIINSLSNNHIKETENGLFDYKFYSRTINELKYISKISEEESAAFNFTLDESYLIKMHVTNEIKNLRLIHGKSGNIGNNQILSLIYLNGILGDLHFFDQEYDSAIGAYGDALQLTSGTDLLKMTITELVLSIKYKLKLGLIFEKVRSYDEALSFYSSVTADAKRYITYHACADLNIYEAVDNYQPQNKLSLDGQTYSTSWMSDLLQIVNQAFIAKIVLQEKMGIQGISGQKFSITVGGFFELSELVKKTSGSNHLINANFYLVLGNLYFYKNNSQALIKARNYAVEYIELEFGKLSALRKNFPGLASTTGRKPLMALWFYCIALSDVIASKSDRLSFVIKEEPKKYKGNICYYLIERIKQKEIVNENKYSKNHYKYMATLLSNIGDCLLSMFETKQTAQNVNNDQKGTKDCYQISIDEIFRKGVLDGTDEIFKEFETINNKIYSKNPNPSPEQSNDIAEAKKRLSVLIKLSNLEHIVPFILCDICESEQNISDILHCYYWSAFLYQRLGRSVSYSFQHRKILYVLRLICKDFDGKQLIENKTACRLVEKYILTPVLQTASETSEYSDRHMFLKYEELFSNKDKNTTGNELHGEYNYFITSNISTHPDTREALSLFLYIALKLNGVNEGNIDAIAKKFISPYNSLATQYTRLFEMDFWIKYNHLKMQSIKANQDEKEHDEAAREFVFALISKLNNLDIYGTDYMINHSFRAYIHFQLGNLIKDKQEKYGEFVKEVGTYFGYKNASELSDARYNLGLAKSYYNKSIQLHTGGRAYRNMLEGILYLEDDINDNAFHFGAALDRYMMVNNVFNDIIRRCDEILEGLSTDYVKGFLGHSLY